jgi:hypothetical protein
VPLQHVRGERHRAEQRVAGADVPLGHQRRPELGTLVRRLDLPAERGGEQLAAEADPERRDLLRDRFAQQVPRRRQPGRDVVVVRAHRAAHHEQAVEPAQRRQRAPVVRRAHVEQHTGPGQPTTEPGDRLGGAVRDRQNHGHLHARKVTDRSSG